MSTLDTRVDALETGGGSTSSESWTQVFLRDLSQFLITPNTTRSLIFAKDVLFRIYRSTRGEAMESNWYTETILLPKDVDFKGGFYPGSSNMVNHVRLYGNKSVIDFWAGSNASASSIPLIDGTTVSYDSNACTEDAMAPSRGTAYGFQIYVKDAGDYTPSEGGGGGRLGA